jgi:hypothetical protein
VQREAQGPIVEEVDLSAFRGQLLELLDGGRGEVADLVRPLLQLGGPEPVVGNGLDVGVLGWIHVRQRVHDAQVAPDKALHELVAGLILQDRVVGTGVLRAAACGEDLRLTLDLLQIGVLTDQPKGIEPFDNGFGQRRVVAHPLVGLM